MPGRDICMHLRSPPAASCAERRMRSSSAGDFCHLSITQRSVGFQATARLHCAPPHQEALGKVPQQGPGSVVWVPRSTECACCSLHYAQK